MVPPGHGWHCKDGYKIFVAGGGALRFDFPKTWVIDPGADHIRLRDRPRPHDRILFEASYFPWAEALRRQPLRELLISSLRNDDGTPAHFNEIRSEERAKLALCWTEHPFLETHELREARRRCCLARGNGLQALLSLSFWPEDTGDVDPIWREILSSIVLGMSLPGPTPVN